ncbi:MAG: altronate dehydratase family protein [Bacteroidota bacterium]
MTHKSVKINSSDNVFVALTDLKKGEIHHGIELIMDIPAKHKFSEENLNTNDFIKMYGITVGKASQKIQKGEQITIFNTKHEAEKYGKRMPAPAWQKPDISKFEGRTFNGYHRADGKVGTANYWVFIPMVFCENQNLEQIKNAFLDQLGYAPSNQFESLTRSLVDTYKTGGNLNEITFQEKNNSESSKKIFENVDGLKFLTHTMGCGGTRDDAQTLCQLLAGYVAHPNVAGATVLSLGCQNAQVKQFEEAYQKIDPNHTKPIYIFDQQTIGNESEMIQKAIKQTFLGLIEANKIVRKPAPLSNITLGVECGGSDGFSGISANPAVGYCSDLLAALNGKIMLAEFPELCGMEQELINRCVSDDLADKFSKLQDAYAKHAAAVGVGFDMNPSPGNIKDGLITDAMKSAGAAKKGGNSPITGVLDYTEIAENSGLNLLCTPGGDAECTTGLAGSGANVLMFTTGLGNPMGNPVCPVLKISTNTKLAIKMEDIIDIDTGTIITGEKSIEQMGEELLELCIATASGAYIPKAVAQGHDDFIPWKRGVSL